MKRFFKSKSNARSYLLFAIFLLAAFFRLYGLNWDQGQHLHPDERFLTMVAEAVKWPTSLSQYLNPQTSPLNPYNANYGFFVYGTLPMYLVKMATELIRFDRYDYNNITLVGRVISTFFDLGTVFLVFKIAQKIFNEKVGLLASFLYATCVLPIQLSHFYAVDTFLVFFIVLSFYFLTLLISHQSLVMSVFLGASFGLALACKVSAVLFLPIIGLGFLYQLLKKRDLTAFALTGFLFSLTAYFSFRLADPRTFSDRNFFNPTPNPQFIRNLKELSISADPNGWFPPAIQWIAAKPMIFPLKNLVLWGLGLPLGAISFAAIFSLIAQLVNYSIANWKKPLKMLMSQHTNILILLWILGLFIYQGVQFGKVSRYFFPIYPFLVLLSAQFLVKFFEKKSLIVHCLFFIILLIYPVSFLSIYTHPHSRVVASEWIYTNIPPGSVLSYEHWDDGLPLGVKGRNNSIYQFEELPLFAPDTQEKWQIINQSLAKIDYMILSSNRLWGSIPKLPQKYPISSKFYQDLFAGKLNFKKIAEFTSYPCFPPVGRPLFCFPDQSADESFTVYDHPKVMIFQKTTNLNQF